MAGKHKSQFALERDTDQTLTAASFALGTTRSEIVDRAGFLGNRMRNYRARLRVDFQDRLTAWQEAFIRSIADRVASHVVLFMLSKIIHAIRSVRAWIPISYR